MTGSNDFTARCNALPLPGDDGVISQLEVQALRQTITEHQSNCRNPHRSWSFQELQSDWTCYGCRVLATRLDDQMIWNAASSVGDCSHTCVAHAPGCSKETPPYPVLAP